MRNARGTNEEAVFTVRVRREKLDRLRLIADSQHRSLAGEIRQMIDDRIADFEPVVEAA